MALDPDRAITQYNIQVWNMEDGLPGNTVYAIQQTQDRYLWIGTGDGLVRFDGFNFELYTREKIPQLKSNVIRALYEDETGTLWIGTDDGGLTRLEHGEFTTYPITEHQALSRISAINRDRRGNLWIGSFNAGLTCLKDNQFITYTTTHGLPHNEVRSIYKDGNRDLWVATAAGIVKLLQPGVFQLYTSKEIQPYFKTVCLYKENTGELWIGTGEKGLFRLKNGIAANYGTEAGIPHPTIIYLYEDRDKNLWIGTDGGGLTRMSPVSGSTIKPVFHTLPGGDGLADGFVYSIYEDLEGSLWAGTLDGGLHQLRDGKFTTYTTREGLVHDYINCIHEGRSGELWFGTKGGLNRLKQGELTTVLTGKDGLLHNSVLRVFEDPSGCLWIGTWGGLHRFKDGKLTILTKKDGLSDHRVRYILGDRQGNTWIGTENGLNRFDNRQNKLTVFTTEQGLSGNRVELIFEDSKGILWLCTDAGLNYLKNGVINTYPMGAGIEDNFFRCVYEDNEGTLWLGSYSGVTRLRGKEINLYNVQAGLIENYVYSILEDERGYLWLGGRNGISRVRKKELEDFSAGKIDKVHPDSYNEKDGMKSRWCTGRGYKTRDGRFWFPTSVGVTMIDPNHIKKNNLAPALIIEKLTVDGETFPIKSFCGGPGGSFFKKRPLAAGGIPELAPGKKRLEFYYTAVSFTNPRRMRFKIKLEGYDYDWVDMGNVHNTTYTRLSPGQYTFKVTACNADGVWNREGASFSFYLRPYFYQTGWFYFLVGILVLLGGFSFYRFRIRHLRAREKELNELVRSRTAELEKQSGKLKELDKIKSRFFANISHEFRTPLTLIMGPLEQMLGGPQEKESQQKKKMRLMLRNSRRLLGLINQLLELSKFDSGTMKLQAAPQNIVPFLKGILHSFDSLAVQNEVELIFQTEAEVISLYYDPEKLEEVISNLLSNAVKFTPAGGRITLAVKIREALSGTGEQDFLEVSVSDTGPGIPPEDMAHIFDRFYQVDSTYEHHRQGTGIGLAIAREIVELHRGVIEAISPRDETMGARFVIRLPMGKGHLKPEEMVEETQKREAGKTDDRRQMTDDSGQVTAEANSNEKLLRGVQGGGFLEKSPPGRRGQEIILVVEDSPDMRQYIRGALEPEYTVIEAKDGEEGLRLAGEIVPDLIICDIMMPGLDGFEVCRALKSDIATSHIPVILLTAKAAEENIIRGLETGAADYITKPFSTKILCARIKNLIDLRRQLQETFKREMTLQPVRMSVSEMDREFLNDLQAVIDRNISDPEFNVDELCSKLYMGRTTLYRKIHALSGETPKEFIRSHRLKRAAELLKNKSGTVLEVSFEVGFSSSSYFAKCFKEKFHQLPSEYQTSESEY